VTGDGKYSIFALGGWPVAHGLMQRDELAPQVFVGRVEARVRFRTRRRRDNGRAAALWLARLRAGRRTRGG